RWPPDRVARNDAQYLRRGLQPSSRHGHHVQLSRRTTGPAGAKAHVGCANPGDGRRAVNAMMTMLSAVWPSNRLRTVGLAAVFSFTAFFVQLAPTELPVPRPEALAPQPVDALGCATEASFTGFVTNTFTTTPATYSTTGYARGYISNVVAKWSCTNAYRYDGLAWMRNDGEGDANYHWGTLINSTSIVCNWVVGETS